MTLDLESPFTPEELAASQMEPRLGLWWQRIGEYGIEHGDGRTLTQEQTDSAIETELILTAGLEVSGQLHSMFAQPGRLHSLPLVEDGKRTWLLGQCGGIHSDPLIRSYARRAFGERDIGWLDQPICVCSCEMWLHAPRRYDPDTGLGRGTIHRCAGIHDGPFSYPRASIPRRDYDPRRPRPVDRCNCAVSRDLIAQRAQQRKRDIEAWHVNGGNTPGIGYSLCSLNRAEWNRERGPVLGDP